MTTTAGFSIPDFVEKCERSVGAADQVSIVQALIEEAISDVPALEAALPDLVEDETLLYASTDLTIFVLRLTPVLLYPPHNHFIPAIIGLYHGTETNFSFVEDGDHLRQTAKRQLQAPTVHCLPPNAIHAVMNEGGEYSKALHVYCGDLTRKERNVWDLDRQIKHDYSDELYFGLAHPTR